MGPVLTGRRRIGYTGRNDRYSGRDRHAHHRAHRQRDPQRPALRVGAVVPHRLRGPDLSAGRRGQRGLRGERRRPGAGPGRGGRRRPLARAQRPRRRAGRLLRPERGRAVLAPRALRRGLLRPHGRGLVLRRAAARPAGPVGGPSAVRGRGRLPRPRRVARAAQDAGAGAHRRTRPDVPQAPRRLGAGRLRPRAEPRLRDRGRAGALQQLLPRRGR